MFRPTDPAPLLLHQSDGAPVRDGDGTGVLYSPDIKELSMKLTYPHCQTRSPVRILAVEWGNTRNQDQHVTSQRIVGRVYVPV